MDVQAKSAGPITDVIQRDMRDREFPDMCKALGGRLLDPFAGKGAAGPADQPDHAPPDVRFYPAGGKIIGDNRVHPGDEPDSMVFIKPDGVRAELETTHGLWYRKASLG